MSPPVPSDLGYVPPDGGWGWAVVFGASVSVGFAYTFPKAFTIYFKELQAVYSISYSQIAWITSIMCATTYGGGKWSKTVSLEKRRSDFYNKRGGENVFLWESSQKDLTAILALYFLMIYIGKTEKTGTAEYFIDSVYDVTNSCYFIRNLAMCGWRLGRSGIIWVSDSYFSIFSIVSFVLFMFLAFFLKQKMYFLHSWL